MTKTIIRALMTQAGDNPFRIWIEGDEYFYQAVQQRGIEVEERVPVALSPEVFEELVVNYFVDSADRSVNLDTLRAMVQNKHEVVYEVFEIEEVEVDELQEAKMALADAIWIPETTIEAIHEKLMLLEPLWGISPTGMEAIAASRRE
jgi:hypothetical protein